VSAGRIFTALLALAACAVACQSVRWEADSSLQAPDADVAAALGDTDHQDDSDLSPEDVPAIRFPRSLRPCCVFGDDVKLEVGRVPVPGVEIGNVLGPGGVGPHRYDNGFLSLEASDPRGFVDDEHNGLVYTCRGGFIDTAHVRDSADATLALADAVARNLDAGAVIALPPHAGDVRIRLRAMPAERIARYGRIRVGVELAQWLAFQLAVWHEIATWYGYESVPAFPEKISSFSPEDLYSNELGARLSAAIILSHGARTDIDYGRNMDAWIQQTLKRLEAVSRSDGRAAAQAVDGAWWDSSRRIPDWRLLLRRGLDFGPFLVPWTLERASPGAKGPVAPLAACRASAAPLVLHVDDGWSGLTFQDQAALEVSVDGRLAEKNFPLPRAPAREVTQQDFPAIVEAIRRENAEAFGADADRP
jgi:hypothetical protein